MSSNGAVFVLNVMPRTVVAAPLMTENRRSWIAFWMSAGLDSWAPCA